ncbi:Nonribosomal Peptide Synthase (NRPS) [Aspergillus melleus]|uniref:Nonribosomal Peptide Synthase (NRPS) n=1 Tax=Aspergillus melleus TaxID=138277 RepID=A0ACC3B1E4_9EURO|nr:Nonribosomal Peptide Synthase (NRPS) [Aspergillus melleus]
MTSDTVITPVSITDTCIFPRLCKSPTDTRNWLKSPTIGSPGSSIYDSLTAHGILPSSLILSAWAIILRYFTESENTLFWVGNQEQILADAPCGRLPHLIRMPVDPDETIRALSQQALVKMQHRHQADSALCNTGLIINDTTDTECQALCEESQAHDQLSVCDVVLDVSLDQEGLCICLHYQESWMTDTDATNVVSTVYQAILSALDSPDGPIRSLPLCSDHQRLMIQEFNRYSTVSTSPHALSWWDSLDQSIMRQRNHKLAIDGWDGQFTFSELDDFSSRVAFHLQAMGIAPPMMIPVCFEKSTWAIIATIGIHRAGAAFVPLDPSLPLERIRSIVSQMGSTVMVVSSLQRSIAEALAMTPIVVGKHTVDALPPGKMSQGQAVSPNDPAYCLFTSGSTGAPKGCVIDQAAFAAISDHCLGLCLNENVRALHFASASFGISIIEIYCTLSAGGTVCVASDEDRASLSNISRAISQMAVNWVIMTPTMISSLSPQELLSVETLISGGEPLQKGHVHTWADHVTLLQGYGFTEWAGICSISGRITSPAHLKTLGRLSPNARAWLVSPLDYRLLAPIGAVAELCIEGNCLAQGYLHDATKTSESFFPRPEWGIGSSSSPDGCNRLYRTGDLVRYVGNGSIQYVGRNDTQRKIRGQRIEVTEIEYSLRECFPKAQRVFAEVIIPVEDGGAQQVLAAFVHLHSTVPDSSTQLDQSLFIAVDPVFQLQVDKAKEVLSTKLPRYMMPDLFLSIRSPPLTITGKLDRRRIRAVASQLRRRELLAMNLRKYDPKAPSTKTEAILTDLLAQVLNIPVSDVGIDDNFFHMGGDSVKAMAVIGKAAAHNIYLNMAEIFRTPTVTQLAHLADGKGVTRTKPTAIPPFSLLYDSDSREQVVRVACDQCQIDATDIEDIYPCTSLQEGMFALGGQQAGGYVARWVYQFDHSDGVDAILLQKAWTRVFREEAILRSRIILSPSQRMYQVVLQHTPIWDTVSLSPDAVTQNGLPDFPVDLGTPLAKLAMHRQNEKGGFALIITIHHSLCDGWSFRKLLDRVEAIYRGESCFPSPPFNIFVQDVLQAPDHKEYWTSELSNHEAEVFPALLPTSYRPYPTSEVKESISWAGFDPGRFTRSTILRLAWGITQAQYQCNNDVIMGLTVSGRNASVSGIDTIIGPTVATIPWRIQLNPAASIEASLDSLVEQATRSIPHEQVGLHVMKQWGGDVASACSFQTLLIIQQMDSSSSYSLLGARGQESSWMAFGTYTLTIVCSLNDDPVELKAWFDPLLIPEGQVKRMLRQLRYVVQTVCRDPAADVASCMTANPHDIDEIIEWNRSVPPSSGRSVPDLISQSCDSHPHQLAVDSFDVQFTYQQLDVLSTGLAKHLVELGVQAGDFLPIFSEKSGWTPVSMLAVMKAGAAFILTDALTPVQRLADSFQQVQPKFILTTTGLLRQTLAITTRAVLFDCEYDDTDLICLPKVQPDQPVFAVFTSGSTGTPKAAMADHQSFLGYSQPIINNIPIDKTVRWLQFSSYAFDMSVNETLWTLIGGGCICILSEEERVNRFVDTVNKIRPTHGFLTPSFARTVDPTDVPSLRSLMFAGEPLQPSDIDTWTPHVELMNAYGPAESGVTHVRYFKSNPNAPCNTVGHATGGAGWLICPGQYEKLAPIGAVGELLLEGPFVGPGYLNNPVKTQDSFIAMPKFVSNLRRASSRVYKTGDLMRYNADGSLVFVGRNDFQVKIRGQRIELSDVETHVTACFPGQPQVIVEFIKPSAGQKQASPYLAAFVYQPVSEAEITSVIDSEAIPSCPWLYKPDKGFQERSAVALTKLRELVPRFMIPSLFLHISRVPQTMSGKVDHRCLQRTLGDLPEVELRQFRARSEQKRAPTTVAETKIQKLCARALGIALEEIGLDDNFLQLGGDSISAMYLVAAAREEGMRITVANVLDHPRLSMLAGYAEIDQVGSTISNDSPAVTTFSLISDELRAEVTDRLLDLGLVDHKDSIEDIIPVTESQAFFLTNWTPVLNCNFLTGPLDSTRLRNACRSVVAARSILRTAFTSTSNGIFQAVLRDTELPFYQTTTEEDLLMHCDAIWNSDCTISSTLNTAPLRFTLVSRSATEHAVIIRLSHAQYDGVSMPTLLDDLRQAYSGRDLRPTVDFSSYLHLRSGQDNSSAFDFWRQYLQGSSVRSLQVSSIAAPPTQASNSRISTGHSVTITELPVGITAASLVKAAAAWLLGRADKTSQDLILGQTVTGRSMPLDGAERMIGPCLNFLPFRINLQPGWSVLQLLQHVQKQCSATLAYDYLDYSDIVRCSTTWPESTSLPCVIQHQNVAQNPVLNLEGTERCTSSGWAYFMPPSGIWILSTPSTGDRLQLMLCTSTAVMPVQAAREWIRDLGKVITLFVGHPHMSVDDIRT